VEGSGHGLISRYYPGISLETLRKTMKKNLSEQSVLLPGFEPGTF
jgi:hypothetical protein